jgi:hypothetical protein
MFGRIPLNKDITFAMVSQAKRAPVSQHRSCHTLVTFTNVRVLLHNGRQVMVKRLFCHLLTWKKVVMRAIANSSKRILCTIVGGKRLTRIVANCQPRECMLALNSMRTKCTTTQPQAACSMRPVLFQVERPVSLHPASSVSVVLLSTALALRSDDNCILPTRPGRTCQRRNAPLATRARRRLRACIF